MGEKVRVLHHVHTMDRGGIETYLMYMLRHYDRTRFHMDILFSGPHEGVYADEARRLGARLIPCRLGYDQVRFIFKCSRIIKEGRYNALNTHLNDFGAGALIAAKIAGVPARVCSYHSNLVKRSFCKRSYQTLMRKIVLLSATAITTSSAEVTESHFGSKGLADSKIESITYGCDTAYFGQSNVEPLDMSRYGISDEHFVIGHVGRYTWQKNHTFLLDIAAEVVKRVTHAKFVLCGSGGSLRRNVELGIEERKLNDFFVQVQDIEEMREYYKALDLFILPSVHEGIPVCIIEAQASGCPVVASRLRGIAAVTCPEQHANLFESSDLQGFVNRICELSASRDLLISMSTAGRNFAGKHLDIMNSIERFQEKYIDGRF